MTSKSLVSMARTSPFLTCQVAAPSSMERALRRGGKSNSRFPWEQHQAACAARPGSWLKHGYLRCEFCGNHGIVLSPPVGMAGGLLRNESRALKGGAASSSLAGLELGPDAGHHTLHFRRIGRDGEQLGQRRVVWIDRRI